MFILSLLVSFSFFSSIESKFSSLFSSSRKSNFIVHSIFFKLTDILKKSQLSFLFFTLLLFISFSLLKINQQSTIKHFIYISLLQARLQTQTQLFQLINRLKYSTSQISHIRFSHTLSNPFNSLIHSHIYQLNLTHRRNSFKTPSSNPLYQIPPSAPAPFTSPLFSPFKPPPPPPRSLLPSSPLSFAFPPSRQEIKTFKR